MDKSCAQLLVNIINHPDLCVMQGRARAVLGESGYATALASHVLIPNHETGGLCVTHNQAILAHVRTLAEAEAVEDIKPSADPAIKPSSGREYVAWR